MQVKILSRVEGLGELPRRQDLSKDPFPPRDPHFLAYYMLLSVFSEGSQ